MTDPDKILQAAADSVAKKNAAARAAGEQPFTPEELEPYIRQLTGGKYGHADVMALNAPSIRATTTSEKIGRGISDAARELLHGATMGTADKILAAMPKFLGGGEAAAANNRAQDDAALAAHPVLGTLARGAGAAATLSALPERWVVGRSVLGSAAKSGGVAAGAGGLEAASQSPATNVPDWLKDIAKGAAVSGVVGGGVGAAAGGIASLPRAARGASKFADAVEAAPTGTLLDKVHEFRAAGLGDQMTMADAGPTMHSLTDFVTQKSPTAFQDISAMQAGREAAAPKDLLQHAQNLFQAGKAVPSPTSENQLVSAMTKARNEWASGPEGYGGIRDATPEVPNTNIKRPMADPAASAALADFNDKFPSAMDATYPKIKDARASLVAAADPYAGMTDAEKNFSDIIFKPKVRSALEAAKQTGLIQRIPEPKDVASYQKMFQFSRLVKGQAGKAFASGDATTGSALKDAFNDIDAHLSDNVAEHAGVNAEYARRSSNIRAVQQGAKDATNPSIDDIAANLKAKNGEQLVAYRSGQASKLFERMQSMRPGEINPGTYFTNASDVEKLRLRTVFGDEKTFSAFMKRAQSQADMLSLNGAISGGPRAGELGIDALDAGIHSMTSTLSSHGASMGRSMFVRGIGKGFVQSWNRNTANAVQPYLMTKGADAVENLIRTFGKRPPLVNAAPLAAGSASGSNLLLRKLGLLTPDEQ